MTETRETTGNNVLYYDGDLHREQETRQALAAMGLSVQVAATFEEARRRISTGFYRLVLVHLAAGNRREAASFCAFAYVYNPVQILMVLMEEPCMWLETQLFDCGVSDVIVGSQACPELIVKRVQARIRTNELQAARKGEVILGDAVVDFDQYEVRRSDSAHPLSGVVLDLLWYLICNAGRVVSRQELCESSVWAHSVCTPPAEGGKTFDIHISRLRKIIERNPGKPMLIQSVRGVGWKLAVKPTWRKREPLSASAPSQTRGLQGTSCP